MFAVFVLLTGVSGASDFECQPNIDTSGFRGNARRLDQFWRESLAYLTAYVHALETPSGGCAASAGAMIDSRSPREENDRCLLLSPDVAAVAKQIKAILAEPDKARHCFDAQLRYSEVKLYTPSDAMRNLTPTSRWIGRPLLSDYYEKLGGGVGAAGRELAANFVAITSHRAPVAHWPSDVSIEHLPTLWSSVGWIPMYAENQGAGSDRFRGGYVYAEVLGPWGSLRIKKIDGELVGAEVGMTVQLAGTYYPVHFHHPQEIYMLLNAPKCEEPTQMMLLPADADEVTRSRNGQGWTLTLGSSDKEWQHRFAEINAGGRWLTYSARNELHAFRVPACHSSNAALVTVWSRTTAQDNEQATRICKPLDGSDPGAIAPWRPVSCAVQDWH